MTIKGLEPFLKARMAGVLIGQEVIVWADRDPSKWYAFADFVGIPEGRATIKDDFRVLVRLDVILVADNFTAQVAAILEKIKEVARSVVFVALSLDDGIVWDREGGERSL